MTPSSIADNFAALAADPRVRAAVGERVFAPCDVLLAQLGDDVGIWGGIAVAPGVTPER